jgi:hypothetical protein
VHVHCELLETHGVKWVYKDDGFLDDPPPTPLIQRHDDYDYDDDDGSHTV